MKTCPTCHRKYTDPTLAFCLDDGSRLTDPLESAETLLNHLPPYADSEATLVNAIPPGSGSAATQVFSPGPNPVEPSPSRPTDPTLVVAPINPSYNPPPGSETRSNRGLRIGLIVGLVMVLLIIVGVFGAGAVVWMYQTDNSNNGPVAKKPTETPSPSPSPSATPTGTPSETPAESPTPEGPASLTGSWTGNWTNSKGNSGTSTIEITEGPNGEITGGEGGDFVMANGHRDGNKLTWQYLGAGDACLDYTCTFEVDSSGTHGHGGYSVEDSCQDTTFTGTYVAYTKQQD